MQAKINIEARATVIALHKSGLNRKQISEETGLNRNNVMSSMSISLWIKRYEEESSLASRQRSGRPSHISEAQRRLMASMKQIVSHLRDALRNYLTSHRKLFAVPSTLKACITEDHALLDRKT